MDCLRLFYLFGMFSMCLVLGNNVTPDDIKEVRFYPSPTQAVNGYVYLDIALANTNFHVNFVVNGDIAVTCSYDAFSTKCKCTPEIDIFTYRNRTKIISCTFYPPGYYQVEEEVSINFSLGPLTLTDTSISVTTIDGLSLANRDLNVQYCGNVTSGGVIQDVPANKGYNSRHNFTCLDGYVGKNLQAYCDWEAQWWKSQPTECYLVTAPLTLATSPNGFLPGSTITASISLVINSPLFRVEWFISNTEVGSCERAYCYNFRENEVSLFSIVRNVSSVDLSMRFQTNAIPASYNISLQDWIDESASFGFVEFSTARCGNPSQAGVSAAPANSGFGASHTFTCTTGYTGTATGLSTCQADGTWSLEGIPTCTIVCDTTTIPPSPFYVSPSTSDLIVVGSSKDLTCTSGYIGSASAVCNAAGDTRSWMVTDGCKAVCSQPSADYCVHGTNTNVTTVTEGSDVNVGCCNGQSGSTIAACATPGNITLSLDCSQDLLF